MTTLILDIETEQLNNPKYIWNIVCYNPDISQHYIFRNVHLAEEKKKFVKFFRKQPKETTWVGHNIINFDLVVLKKHIPFLEFTKVDDTLVMSRLYDYKRTAGHSLESWGDQLGFFKSSYDDFSKWSQELEDRCVLDTILNYKVYKYLLDKLKDPSYNLSLSIEHEMAHICAEMSTNGFTFNIKKAKELLKNITDEREKLERRLIIDFPPKYKPISVVTPKSTKEGNISFVNFKWLDTENDDINNYWVGAPFTRLKKEVFNPRSTSQIVERLNEAGWKPTSKTKGHIEAERNRDKEKLEKFKKVGWKVDEENLATLPEDAPEAAKTLSSFLTLSSRESTLREWVGLYNERTGRIHGYFQHIGAWTHRMSHSNPNMANIPSRTLYHHEMRSLWTVPENHYLVGVDAESIQLRILAHYIKDDDFTQSLISGNKQEETDPHSLNKAALGPICKSRDAAKTFIYAWVLGASLTKITNILDCTYVEAAESVQNFLKRYPGLKDLKENQIPHDAKKGYFIGLDGRKVFCNSEHLMLAGYLQNGESVAMKLANIMWKHNLNEQKIPYKQVNFVHDEWQTETNSYDNAVKIAKIQASALEEAGHFLKLHCPLAGSFKHDDGTFTIGSNWSDTH